MRRGQKKSTARFCPVYGLAPFPAERPSTRLLHGGRGWSRAEFLPSTLVRTLLSFLHFLSRRPAHQDRQRAPSWLETRWIPPRGVCGTPGGLRPRPSARQPLKAIPGPYLFSAYSTTTLSTLDVTPSFSVSPCTDICAPAASFTQLYFLLAASSILGASGSPTVHQRGHTSPSHNRIQLPCTALLAAATGGSLAAHGRCTTPAPGGSVLPAAFALSANGPFATVTYGH